MRLNVWADATVLQLFCYIQKIRIKENGVHENELSVKFYRDRTNILHHNKVFGQLLEIGDKNAIAIYNKLLNSNLE